jgi:hypothetical protein
MVALMVEGLTLNKTQDGALHSVLDRAPLSWAEAGCCSLRGVLSAHRSGRRVHIQGDHDSGRDRTPDRSVDGSLPGWFDLDIGGSPRWWNRHHHQAEGTSHRPPR